MSIVRTVTPRILIVGCSESGKSTLAKAMARNLEKRGVTVTVYDPINSEWSPEAFVTYDQKEFFEEVKQSHASGEKQVAFMDEADTLLSVADKQNHWILTRGRHYAIMPVPITQRPALVAPTVRGQCNELYCFAVSKPDAKLLAEDFAHDGLLAAPSLNQGEYLHCHWVNKQKVVDKGKIF